MHSPARSHSKDDSSGIYFAVPKGVTIRILFIFTFVAQTIVYITEQIFLQRCGLENEHFLIHIIPRTVLFQISSRVTNITVKVAQTASI